MSNSRLSWYLFNNIPGVWVGWVLAVLAVSQHDARKYINIHNGGGRYIGEITTAPTAQQAHCGAVTEAAESWLRNSGGR